MIKLMPEGLRDFFSVEWAETGLRIVLILAAGILLTRIIGFLAGRVAKKRLSPQSAMLVRKVIRYSGGFVILLAAFQQLGLQLGALLGAAGVVGIAVGFAAQTSMSNLISGLFLIWEKPFAVGDVIRIGGTVGVVLSIDLLSVKARTFDNQYVRLPNQQIISTELVNITRFPIRRMDINIGVAYKEDVGRVRQVLMELAAANPHCLDEPEPLLIFTNFGDSALEFLFAIWFEKNDYLVLKNSMMQQIKERFDAEGIEIPFPHTTVYTGVATEPFPVRVVDDPRD